VTGVPRPSHLSGEYGAWFKNPLVVAAYPSRPAYPTALIQALADLVAHGTRVVLDVRCGTVDLARRLAPLVERVDAGYFSSAIIEHGHQRAGGDAANLRWILGAVEEVQFWTAYGLVTAGESLRWMDWEVVLPRFAEVLTANGMLAIAGRFWDGPPMLWERLLPIIERYTPVRDFRPYNLVQDLVDRRLFEKLGEQRFGPEPWLPSVDEYLECRHSQRGLSRTHMGLEAVIAYDAATRQALEDLCQEGILARCDGRLQLTVEGWLTWGLPGSPCVD
jgi:SAM-dependent methyltransferase